MGVMDQHELQVTTEDQLRETLNQISFKNTVLDFKWRFEYEPVHVTGPNMDRYGWLVWVSFERPDTDTGKIGRGRGRDEIIWGGTSLSGVVKTAWVLVSLMISHEAMESFRWMDYRIFNPHHSVIDLASVQKVHEQRISHM